MGFFKLSFGLLEFQKMMSRFSKLRFGFVEFNAVFLDGFLHFLDGGFISIDLVAGTVESAEILVVNGVDIVPIVDELFAAVQVEIHEQFFDSKLTIRTLFFFSELRWDDRVPSWGCPLDFLELVLVGAVAGAFENKALLV